MKQTAIVPEMFSYPNQTVIHSNIIRIKICIAQTNCILILKYATPIRLQVIRYIYLRKTMVTNQINYFTTQLTDEGIHF